MTREKKLLNMMFKRYHAFIRKWKYGGCFWSVKNGRIGYSFKVSKLDTEFIFIVQAVALRYGL